MTQKKKSLCRTCEHCMDVFVEGEKENRRGIFCLLHYKLKLELNLAGEQIEDGYPRVTKCNKYSQKITQENIHLSETVSGERK